MIRDLIIEQGFRFLAYHDTVGSAPSGIAHPENESRGIWMLIGMFVLIGLAFFVFMRQNNTK